MAQEEIDHVKDYWFQCLSDFSRFPLLFIWHIDLAFTGARIIGKCMAAALAMAVLGSTQAHADLNKFEADVRGEFGIGSAAQFGSADLRS